MHRKKSIPVVKYAIVSNKLHENVYNQSMAIPPNRSLGTMIHEARTKASLSLRQTAEEAGISKSLLAFWEKDLVESPELGKLLRLAAVLEIDPTTICEAAGYNIGATLPTLRPYLRSKYPDLPDSALAEIAAITEKYGVDPNNTGPSPGEDQS